jgi:hypothetical protein
MPAANSKIESDKIFVQDLLTKWFRIPDYQRAYVWGKDQIWELLGDLIYALRESPDAEYFLGSTVLRRNNDKKLGYEEFEVLDGQQRLTTLLLLLAVIRDRTDDDELIDTCQECLCQKENKLRRIPGRFRLESDSRGRVQAFMNAHIQKPKGTLDSQLKQSWDVDGEDKSARNMALAVLEIQAYFKDNGEVDLQELTGFLLNQVLMIYVATDELDDAFRLFTILNNRGMPLRNSDILKATNLGLVPGDKKSAYAKEWEEMESELDDNVDRFLAYIRTILVKEKARHGMIKEFNEKVFVPKLISEGKAFLDLLFEYFGHHQHLLVNKQGGSTERRQLDNLISIMREGLPGTDWVPPLLAYYHKFRNTCLVTFLTLLDNKVSADLMTGVPPTTRIENLNAILKSIEKSNQADTIINDTSLFKIDRDDLRWVLNGKVYGRRFTKYVLLKLNYLKLDHSLTSLDVSRAITVEHILPQNPEENSQWKRDFTDAERNELVHKLGNIVLLGRGKNASLGRLDFAFKTGKYFKGYLSISPHLEQVLHNKKSWTPKDITENQTQSLNDLLDFYCPVVA